MIPLHYMRLVNWDHISHLADLRNDIRYLSVICAHEGAMVKGLLRELNPGPLAPEARIMPPDQAASCKFMAVSPHDVLLPKLPPHK